MEKGELKKFKKPIGPLEWKPFDLDKMTKIITGRMKRKQLIKFLVGITILCLILIVLILIEKGFL